MHSIVRAFSEHRPRVYGLLMLAVGIAVGFVGQRITAAAVAFLVLLIAAGYGAAGIYYLVFGSHAHRSDVRFQERFFPPVSLYWWQVCMAIALGVGLLLLAGALYWLLR